MTIGEKVRIFREQRGLSQRAFARRCGLSNAAISYLEKGIGSNGEPYKAKVETLHRIARVMGTTMESLISDCDDFVIDISDQMEETPLVKKFIEEASKRSPDEEMILQAYRAIPAEHRIEAMQAVLSIMMKYEN